MTLQIYFNPLDKACKSITGAVRQNEAFTFNIFNLKNKPAINSRIDADLLKKPSMEECIKPTKPAFLHVNRDNEDSETYEMQQTSFGWTISLSISEIGLYFYYFSIENQPFISCGKWEMGILSERPNAFLLTVSSVDYTTPEWFKGGTMYQIFPDRFAKEGVMPDIKGRILRDDWGGTPSYKPNSLGKVLNNDFFGGNFKGIQSKLPYLSDLGITVIYLNPIFEAASNHRYDTSDYMHLDPILGNEEDFSQLIEKANEFGIKIILDGVFNHTGDDSVYFNKYGHYSSLGAYQSKESPYYTWYSFEEFPCKYESWWGIDILPEVNEHSESYQHFIFEEGGVLKKWLSFGVFGYRLDVADELPDFFLKKLRKSVKESNQNAIIIGEVWEDASNKIAYSKRREYLLGYELDSVMNYPLKEAIISYIQTGKATYLLQSIHTLINHYPKETLDCLMNILGTHDTARILTVLGGIYCQNKDEMAKESAYMTEEQRKIAIEKLKMAAVLQFTLPGVPSIYYGDENGMEGHIDPFCRKCFDWQNLNLELISFYQKLGMIRKNNKNVFATGEYETIYIEDGVFAFSRKQEEQTIYVYANNSSKRYLFNIEGKFSELLTDKHYETVVEIKPYSYLILQKEI